jgi:hypothetical protein
VPGVGTTAGRRGGLRYPHETRNPCPWTAGVRAAPGRNRGCPPLLARVPAVGQACGDYRSLTPYKGVRVRALSGRRCYGLRSFYSVAKKALQAAAVTVNTAPSRLVVSRIITLSADATSMQFPPSALL